MWTDQMDCRASWKVWAGSAGTREQVAAIFSNSACLDGSSSTAAMSRASREYRAANSAAPSSAMRTASKNCHLSKSSVRATSSSASRARTSAWMPFSPRDRSRA